MIQANRRQILFGFGTLVGAGFALATHGPTRATPALTMHSPRLLQHCWLAGFHHYQPQRYLHRCALDHAITLLAEPDNPFDARAVMVQHQGVKIGYVPRADNATLSDLLMREQTLLAKITQVNPYDLWQPLQFAVYF